MPSTEYTVRLDAFHGPMDLLLFVIRRAEVDIHDIPIAVVTEQYLKHLEQLAGEDESRIDIERAGEFLVMAATLMEIKSRMLQPPSQKVRSGDADAPATDDDDPRAELVRQLLEYKRFRDASTALEHFKSEWESRFPSGRAHAGKEQLQPVDPEAEDQGGPVDVDDLQLLDLVEAFGRILQTVDMTRVGEHRVVMDDTPVEIHAEDIVDRLSRLQPSSDNPKPQLALEDIVIGRSRSEAIGLFLAILELVKQQRVLVAQEDTDRLGRRIVLRLSESAATPSPAPNTTDGGPA